MSLLLHQKPLVLIPFQPGIKCQIRVFWKHLFHAYCRLLLHCAFCFSIVPLYRFHQLQQYQKISLECLFENSLLHRLKHAESTFFLPLFLGQLQLLVNPLKTSVKYWPILSVLNAGVICQTSIRNCNYYISSFLFGQSKVFDNLNVNILNAFSYG
jgi:hypothetical protein